MEEKLLIREIKSRPILWDANHEHFNDRFHKRKAWIELAAELSMPEPLLRAKWKCLRTIFNRNLKRQNCSVTDTGRPRRLWKHYKALQFLREAVDGADTQENETCTEDEDSIVNNSDEDSIEDKLEFDVEHSKNGGNEQIMKSENPIRTNGTDKKRKIYDDDFDLMFLKSLLPYFREIEPIRKLVLRNKMQNMLMNELTAQGTTYGSSSSIKNEN